MSTEDNKRIVRQFFDLLNAKDHKGISALLADDHDWWILGNIPLSGHKDKRAIQLGFKLIHRVFEGFAFTLHDLTAEENRVAVTAESHAKHPSGRAYNNHYHFLFWIENKQIARVKEYFDTQHALWIEHGDG